MTDPYAGLLGGAQEYATDELKSDPYYLLTQGITSAPMNFSNPYANALGNLAQNFIGGFGTEAATGNYRQNLQDAYSGLSGLFTGQAVPEEYAGYAPQVRSAINDYNLERQNKFNDALMANNLSFGKDIAGKMYDQYLKFESDPSVLAARAEGQQVPNPYANIGKTPETTAFTPADEAAIQNAVAKYGAKDPTLLPPTPEGYEAKKAELGVGEGGVYRPNLSQDPRVTDYVNEKKKMDENRIFDIEDKGYKEISANKGVATIAQALSTLPQMEELAQVDSKTSDIPFVYKFIQGLDGGVIKEGEYNLVQGVNPLLQKWQAALEGELNATSRLTPTMKIQMVNELKGALASQWENTKVAIEPQLKKYERRGAKRENLLPFNDAYVKSSLGMRGNDLNNPPANSIANAAMAEIEKRKAQRLQQFNEMQNLGVIPR